MSLLPLLAHLACTSGGDRKTSVLVTIESPDPAAIADPDQLARWWGPAGFTSTFELESPHASHIAYAAIAWS